MMIRALQRIEGEYIPEGEGSPVPVDLEIDDEADVTDAYGRHLIALGYAEEVS